MDDINHGCKLAKELESSLPNLVDQPQKLSELCGDIIRAFTDARESLINNTQERSSSSFLYSHHMLPQMAQNIDPSSFQEYIRKNTEYSSAMGLLQTHLVAAGIRRSHEYQSGLLVHEAASTSGVVNGDQSSGRDVQAVVSAALDSGNIGTSSQRPRRRNDDGEKRTVMAPAPQTGNTEIPPEDGFTWRKYGQKEILGSLYPRSYYRCTHQKMYLCPAKKQVQRVDSNPSIYEVTYRGDHTCHMSATAPSGLSLPPPPPPHLTQLLDPTTTTTTTSIAAASSAQPSTLSSITGIAATSAGSLGRWLDFTLGAGGSTGGAISAGPSTVRSSYGPPRDQSAAHDQYPISDMADVMFNSGSSSGNSMEFIFTMDDHKWDISAQKKH